MRQSYRMIPVYTADVSGVCSALYELGGMTVMHTAHATAEEAQAPLPLNKLPA